MNYRKLFGNVIELYHSQGMSGRQIAARIGTSKSFVNDYIKEMVNNTPSLPAMNDEGLVAIDGVAKVLLLDLELSPTMASVWRIWKENIGLDQISQDWVIMSYAAKWLHEDVVVQNDCRDTPEDDSMLLYELHDLLSKADIVVAHNVKFDIPKAKTRMAMQGLDPVKPFKTYCTLEAAKKNFSFTSNKLEYLADKLGVHKKRKHSKFPGFLLWKECLAGNEEAWNEMEAYNIDDVWALQDVYTALRAWDNTHPNVSVYTDDEALMCPCCGSKSLFNSGYAHTNVGLYNAYRCNACGRHSRSRFTINTTNKRKHLLV